MGRGKINRVMGMCLALLAGLIHIFIISGKYQDDPYLGALVFGFFLAYIVSAIGNYYDQYMWGWKLGVLLSLSAIIGYLINRTVGLPILGIKNWGPLLVYFSIFLGLLVFVPFIRAATPRLTRSAC